MGEPARTESGVTETVEKPGTRYDFAFVSNPAQMFPVYVLDGDDWQTEFDDRFEFVFANGVRQVVLKANLARYQVVRFAKKIKVPISPAPPDLNDYLVD